MRYGKPRASPAAQTRQPEGRIRQSQIVTTFGPGALVDLVGQAVLIGGLDFWSASASARVIHEPRLRERLIDRLKLDLDHEKPFRAPPVGEDGDPNPAVGIQVLEFPQWFVCQNPACRALVESRSLELKRERYIHRCHATKETECVPVRFLGACPRGHIQDFPWLSYVHIGKPICAAPQLNLKEGVSGDFSEIQVVCSCGAHRKLADAKVPDMRPSCRGRRPWLGQQGDEECDDSLHLLTRTATNTYFAQSVSALSIPEHTRELENIVREHWPVLKTATEVTLPVFRTIEALRVALAKYSDADVLEMVRAIEANRPAPRGELRTAEYKEFLQQPDEEPGAMPAQKDEFFARALPMTLPEGLSKVVVAHLLREVRVQVGFTRLESISPDLQGEYDANSLKVQMAPLGLTPKWLPACEVKGEGLLLAFDEEAIRKWEQRPQVRAREKELHDGYDVWRKTVKSAPDFPGVRFYFLHSLSHLLISAIALECGYSASAIRERIYCAPADAETPMAGILLHTGSSGTEGTLGGLVEQGRQIQLHLQHALSLGALCSNDPVCASHSPRNDPSERYLEGAACHGCLFQAECSCERFNHFLDRALVVPTIGRDGLAFFENGA